MHLVIWLTADGSWLMAKKSLNKDLQDFSKSGWQGDFAGKD
jgi:hypothetical protein